MPIVSADLPFELSERSSTSGGKKKEKQKNHPTK